MIVFGLGPYGGGVKADITIALNRMLTSTVEFSEVYSPVSDETASASPASNAAVAAWTTGMPSTVISHRTNLRVCDAQAESQWSGSGGE